MLIRTIFIIQLILITVLKPFAQDSSHLLIMQMQNIDSVTKSIDINQLFLKTHLVGNSEFGEFKADCYYIDSKSEFFKVNYYFKTDSLKSVNAYYLNNQLIKLIYNNSNIYYHYCNNFFSSLGINSFSELIKKLDIFLAKYNKIITLTLNHQNSDD